MAREATRDVKAKTQKAKAT
jgi:hypothetical protein